MKIGFKNLTKKDVVLFASFTALFILFALFQNFSFVRDFEQELPKNTIDVTEKIKNIRFFRPYLFREAIGNLETPIGFTDSIRKQEGPKIFDEKKYLDNKMKEAPLYKSLKNILDFRAVDNSQPCVEDPAAKTNNCLMEYNSNSAPTDGPSGSLRFRSNPLRKTASVSYSGSVDSELYYENGVNLELKKQIAPNTNVKIEMKSQDQSGQVNIDLRW